MNQPLPVPPAARNLPLPALDSATDGANTLDAWAKDPHGRNFLAHALVQLARDGWLRTEPGQGFEPCDDERPAPEQHPCDPLCARQSASTPVVGPSRGSGGTSGPQTGAEGFGLPEFIDVARYRHDHGHQAWAWRCWGDGDCNGWLALDKSSEESARRGATRHLTEAHPPAAEQPVEQMARFLAGAAHVNPKRDTAPWDSLDDADRDHYREQARRIVHPPAPDPKDCCGSRIGHYPGCATRTPDSARTTPDNLTPDHLDVQFSVTDCTCIPWTRQDGAPRYLGPSDTVDKISGWERGRDCPHHGSQDLRIPTTATELSRMSVEANVAQNCTPAPESSDPAQCSGEEGLCPEHGYHRHSLKQPAPEASEALRDLYAAAIREAACPGGCGATEEECRRQRIQPEAWHRGVIADVSGTPEQFADAVTAVRDRQQENLRGLLAEAVDWIPDGDLRERICAALNPQETP